MADDSGNLRRRSVEYTYTPHMSVTGRRWIAIIVAVLIGSALAAAGSWSGGAIGGVPLVVLAVAATFLIQWAVFVPSWLARTERFFDLTGSATFVVITFGLACIVSTDARGWLLCAMVGAWALRLGTFLFVRVLRDGGDGRFDELKASLPAFLSVWTMQGLWVTATALGAWIAIADRQGRPLGWLSWLGLAVWVTGFALEALADAQKRRFRANPANRGEFIREGLWSRSRHPNYFGEILLWIGVMIVAAPTFDGWQWVGVLSPAFVALLLLRVSGIPILERRARERWGDREDYREYVRSTPVLVPRLTR